MSSTKDGRYLRQWRRWEINVGEFNHPWIVVIHDSSVYVCDTSNFRIQVFGLDGAFKSTWGKRRDDEHLPDGGEFLWPNELTFQNDLFFVTNWFPQKDSHVQVFREGNFVVGCVLTCKIPCITSLPTEASAPCAFRLS